ncbi:hypothetical protein GOBAR_DD11059 [Gossypium barbadense]|nr:hypothetical protein GOBAR_DD11059 [Gossypium barbadense]
MDNKEVKIFDRIEEAEEGEICVSDNQPLAIPYSADQPLVIYYEAKKEEVNPKVIIKVPSPFPYKDNKAVPRKYDVNIVVPKGEKSKATTGSVSGKGKAPIHEVEVDVEMPFEQKVKRPVVKEYQDGN